MNRGSGASLIGESSQPTSVRIGWAGSLYAGRRDPSVCARLHQPVLAVSSRILGVADVKESELWFRMQAHLGEFYCRVWAAEFSLAELKGRTVLQALADGEPCKTIWRAVWAALELPARER